MAECEESSNRIQVTLTSAACRGRPCESMTYSYGIGSAEVALQAILTEMIRLQIDPNYQPPTSGNVTQTIGTIDSTDIEDIVVNFDTGVVTYDGEPQGTLAIGTPVVFLVPNPANPMTNITITVTLITNSPFVFTMTRSDIPGQTFSSSGGGTITG